MFANSSDLAFGRVNKSASEFVLKVVFVVFECYKSLSFSHTFCLVGNVEISSDVFGLVVNSVDCVSVGFLVGRCNVVQDQLVVRGFVHFVVFSYIRYIYIFFFFNQYRKVRLMKPTHDSLLLRVSCLRTHQTVFNKENSYHLVYVQACEKLLLFA